jgi:hypothetical protein
VTEVPDLDAISYLASVVNDGGSMGEVILPCHQAENVFGKEEREIAVIERSR